MKRLSDFVLVSIFATLTSAFMLLPTFLDLKSHGEVLTEQISLFSSDIWYFDFLLKVFLVVMIRQNMALFQRFISVYFP